MSFDVLLRSDEILDEGAEPIAARFEIGELVVGSAGRRKKHDRFLRGARRGVARSGRRRDVQRPAALVRYASRESFREGFARRADQIGLDDLRKKRPQRLEAALFGFAAEDPENVGK